MNSTLSRRSFLSGLAACGALSGTSRLFAAPAGLFSQGKANLLVGIISDTHIQYSDADPKAPSWQHNAVFRNTLKWFREQRVDVVIIAGDMTNYGMVDEMQVTADTWDEVFPGNKGLDGQPVEKFFILGNHDFQGHLYGNNPFRKKYPDEATFAQQTFRSNIPAHYEKLFHEPYSRFTVKTVKGYTFLGAHWDDGTGYEKGHGDGHSNFGPGLKQFLSEKGATLDRAKPFFYVQHPHPQNTCYGSWAWGRDRGFVTEALKNWPNAIAFSGHSHYSLTDERTVWQDGFTSIGTSSLRYTGLPYDCREPFGYENTYNEKGDNELNALKVMPEYPNTHTTRQGMLMRVFDDRVVFERRDFENGAVSLGDDWVLPIGSDGLTRARTFAAAAAAAKAPQFPAGATLKAAFVKAKTRKTPKQESIEKDALEITIPLVIADEKARVHEYEVAARADDGSCVTFNVLAEGYNQALNHLRAQTPTKCAIRLDRLPANMVSIEVTPMDSWLNRGKSLYLDATRLRENMI